MKEHKLFVIASLLLSRAWATTLEDALASNYADGLADCYVPSGTCSCTSIGFPWNSLTGTIPASLGSLSALTDLQLHDNSLTGTVPASLGSLSALTVLLLYDNSLTGELPAAWCDITLNYGSCASENSFKCSSICPSGSGPCDLTSSNCQTPAPTATPTVTPAPVPAPTATPTAAPVLTEVSRATSLIPGVGVAIVCACAVLATTI